MRPLTRSTLTRSVACLPFALVVTACSMSAGTIQDRPAPPVDPALDSVIAAFFDELGLVPGLSVAIVRDSTTIHVAGYGVADASTGAAVTPRTPFYIASSTKGFMGLASAILAERGTWNLDDPLTRWLPEAGLPAPLSPDDVTLRGLLTHSSRIDNDPIVFRTAYSGEHDPATLVALIKESELHDPGFVYGNIGYVLASLAMDRAAGQSWQDVLRAEIFSPLGMTHTSARRSELNEADLAHPHGVAIDNPAGPFEVRRYIKTDENMHAAGGIISSALDLAAWLQVNLNEGRLDGRQVVSATAVRASHGKLVDVDARFYQFARRAYGLGWYHGDYEGELLMHDFGNYPGFRAHVSFMPAHGIGVAVLANESAQGYFMPEAIATLIYDRLLGKPDLAARRDSVVTFLRADAENVRQSIARDQARRAARPDTLAFPLSAYTGTFVEPEAGTMRITASGTTLRASIGVLTGEMEPVDGQTQLRVELVPGSGDLVDFFISSGRADSLTYGGRNFRRTDGPR